MHLSAPRLFSTASAWMVFVASDEPAHALMNAEIEDKSFLHKNHPGNQKGKYHLKIILESNELSKINKIDSNKKIYKILSHELKEYIHSIQILIT